MRCFVALILLLCLFHQGQACSPSEYSATTTKTNLQTFTYEDSIVFTYGERTIYWPYLYPDEKDTIYKGPFRKKRTLNDHIIQMEYVRGFDNISLVEFEWVDEYYCQGLDSDTYADSLVAAISSDTIWQSLLKERIVEKCNFFPKLEEHYITTYGTILNLTFLETIRGDSGFTYLVSAYGLDETDSNSIKYEIIPGLLDTDPYNSCGDDFRELYGGYAILGWNDDSDIIHYFTLSPVFLYDYDEAVAESLGVSLDAFNYIQRLTVSEESSNFPDGYGVTHERLKEVIDMEVSETPLDYLIDLSPTGTLQPKAENGLQLRMNNSHIVFPFVSEWKVFSLDGQLLMEFKGDRFDKGRLTAGVYYGADSDQKVILRFLVR